MKQKFDWVFRGEQGFSLVELFVVLGIASTASYFLLDQAGNRINIATKGHFDLYVLESKSELIETLANPAACQRTFGGLAPNGTGVTSVYRANRTPGSSTWSYRPILETSLTPAGRNPELQSVSLEGNLPRGNTGEVRAKFTFRRGLEGGKELKKTTEVRMLAQTDLADRLIFCQTYDAGAFPQRDLFCKDPGVDCAGSGDYCGNETFLSATNCLCIGSRASGANVNGRSCEKTIVAAVSPTPLPIGSPWYPTTPNVVPLPDGETVVTGAGVTITSPAVACAAPASCRMIAFTVNAKYNPYLVDTPNNTPDLFHTLGLNFDRHLRDADPTIIGEPFIVAGNVLEFSATGGADINNEPVFPGTTADGSTRYSDLEDNFMHRAVVWGSPAPAGENGINYTRARTNAMMGIFLGPGAPTATPYSTPNSADSPTDYTVFGSEGRLEYRPAIKQPFQIGDGLTELGTGVGTRQRFIVPAGATRLVIFSHDGGPWRNNIGGFSVDLRSSTP